MRQRAFLCCLLSALMLFYSFSLLPFQGEPLAQAFAYSWVAFAIIVLIGNSLQLLYRKETKVASVSFPSTAKKRLRQRE